MSSNPPPSGYQIGAGTPLNQQYLQPESLHPTANPDQQPYYPPPPAGGQQQPQHDPQQPYQAGHPSSYPLQYQPGAPDIPSQGNGQYMMSGGLGPSGPAGPAPGSEQQQQPYFPPPPPHQHESQIPQTQPQGQTQQEHYYPPPQQPPVASEQSSQQYYPPPLMHAAGGYDDSVPPPQPPRPEKPPQNAPDGYHDSIPPPQPPRPGSRSSFHTAPDYQSQSGALTTASGGYPVPPRRHSAQFGDDDPSNPIHYSRDPHKLVAYLVPFPKPQIKGVAPDAIPDRFLIYTPPPPPLTAPREGEKEDKLHKVQRKWQEEVRAAKTSDAKTASWKGVKSKATKGISYVMSKTTTSNLDFVNRIPGAKARSPSPSGRDAHADDGVHEGDTTHKTVGLEEMVLVYPSSYAASPDQVKTEFVNTMMRTKSKAQRDAVLATGLLPVSAAIDIMATLIWPFGGLLEVDSVWAYSSIRGAKTARSVTKRLSSSTTPSSAPSTTGNTNVQPSQTPTTDEAQLHLSFTQSPRLSLLTRYLNTRCRDIDAKHFPTTEVPPTETEVLAAIGWAPSNHAHGAEQKNWEDEEWETREVREDLKQTLGKAAKEWDKWCLAFAKDPEKALKK